MISRESSVDPAVSESEGDASKEEASSPAKDAGDDERPEDEAKPSAEPSAVSEAVDAETSMQVDSGVSEPLNRDSVKDEDVHQPKVETVDEAPEPVPDQESRDWTELSMLEKLDSLHLLMEWQFQNPYRLRQIMKSDDELASWVSTLQYFSTHILRLRFQQRKRVEPIGYDAKTNAYWLIGRMFVTLLSRDVFSQHHLFRIKPIVCGFSACSRNLRRT